METPQRCPMIADKLIGYKARLEVGVIEQVERQCEDDLGRSIGQALGELAAHAADDRYGAIRERAQTRGDLCRKCCNIKSVRIGHRSVLHCDRSPDDWRMRYGYWTATRRGVDERLFFLMVRRPP